MMARERITFDALRSRLDVFEALKLAMMSRGLVRQKPMEVLSNDRAVATENPELASVADNSHEILFKANTVFPFTLFPDTVTLDREKLNFAIRYFFRVAQETSVPIRDILSVEVDVGLFFGSVHTASRYYITSPKVINYLWRSDAIKLQRLLQGYIIAHEREIDCSSIKKDSLTKLLIDLGRGQTG